MERKAKSGEQKVRPEMGRELEMLVRGKEDEVQGGEAISKLRHRSSVLKVPEKAGRDESKTLQSQ